MDVKTLSTIIGHASSNTTLNIYAHVTDEIRQSAAANIDRGIAKTGLTETTGAQKEPEPLKFTPQPGPTARSIPGMSMPKPKPSARKN